MEENELKHECLKLMDTVDAAYMKSFLSPMKNERSNSMRIAFALLLAFLLMPSVCESKTPQAEKVLTYLKSMGNGSYMFGQMATWVHNENPDMDHGTNWLRKVYAHTARTDRKSVV